MAKAAVTPQFESILDTSFDNVERPKPLPQGSWFTVVTGYRFDKSSQQQTDFVEFTHRITEAGEDVDEDELQKFLTAPDGSKKELKDTTVRNTYYMTDNAMYRLKAFLQHCGVDTAGGNPRRTCPEAVNCEVGIFVKHKPWQNNEGVSVDISRTFPIE